MSILPIRKRSRERQESVGLDPMAAGREKRDEHRVAFSRGIPVRIVAIDGTWNRHCQMMDASGRKIDSCAIRGRVAIERVFSASINDRVIISALRIGLGKWR